MAIYKEDIVAVELSTGTIHRSFLNRAIGSGDEMADRFGVQLFRDGNPVSVESCAVSGVFMAPDGEKYAINETSWPGSTGKSGNKAWIQLPGICYAVRGQFCLAIKISGGSVNGTMRIIDGTVDETGEDGAVVPTSTIPTTADIIAAYEEAIDVIGTAVRFDVEQSLDDEEKEQARNNIGAVSYAEVSDGIAAEATARAEADAELDGKIAAEATAREEADDGIYSRLLDISGNITSEATAREAADNALDGRMIAAEVADNSLIGAERNTNDRIITIPTDWKTGYYDKTTGEYDTWSRSICTKRRFYISVGGLFACAPDGRYIQVNEYDENGSYIGYYGNFNPDSTVDSIDTNSVFVKTVPGHSYTFTVGHFADGDAASYLNNTFISQIVIANVQTESEMILTEKLRLSPENYRTGYYKRSDGTYDTWTRAICDIQPFVAETDGNLRIEMPEGRYAAIAEYNTSGEYQKTYGWVNDSTSDQQTNTLHISVKAGYSYHFCFGYFYDGQSGYASEYLTKEFLDTVRVYTSTEASGIYDLIPAEDGLDRAAEITAILQKKGVCRLSPGKFCVSGVSMPDSSMIIGCGNKTNIRLVDTEETNIWTAGDKSFTQEETVVLGDSYPAGIYSVHADVSSNDTDSEYCSFVLYKASPYISTNEVGRVNLSRGTDVSGNVSASAPFVAVCLQASNTYAHGAGDTATFANIVFVSEGATAITLGSNCTIRDVQISGSDEEIELPETAGKRHGIGYYGTGRGSPNEHGVIDGCFIHGFTGGGIHLYNTGQAVSSGLNINNVYSYNNHAGLLNEHLSEFHRISNSAFIWNYIGVVCNGGNNQFTGCAFSRNYYGFVYDNSSDDHPNGTHGSAVGCILQHNQICAIYMNRARSGFMFTSCNLDPNTEEDKGIELVDSNLVVFSACNFMAYMNITITGGKLVHFTGCNFRNSMTQKTSITNNNAVRFTNCFTTEGTPVDPTA